MWTIKTLTNCINCFKSVEMCFLLSSFMYGSADNMIPRIFGSDSRKHPSLTECLGGKGIGAETSLETN